MLISLLVFVTDRLEIRLIINITTWTENPKITSNFILLLNNNLKSFFDRISMFYQVIMDQNFSCTMICSLTIRGLFVPVRTPANL